MKMLLSAIAVALFATGAAYAQADHDQSSSSMPAAQAKKFDKLDRDKDGVLSKSEAQKDDTLKAEFAAVDQDSDGKISRSEYTAMAQTQPSQPSRRDSTTRDPTSQPPRDYGQPPR